MGVSIGDDVMGVIDEHWCSECNKSLDKKKEKYMEVDFIHDKKKGKHNRAFLCMKCLNKHPEIKKKFGKLRIKGNPNFIATIECKHHDKCETYEYRNEKVRCKHIAVIDDKIYCKRRHPGATKLFQEKSMIEERKLKIMQDALKNLLGNHELSPQLNKFIQTAIPKGDLDAIIKAQPHPNIVVEKIDDVVEKRLEEQSLKEGEKDGEISNEV